MDKKRILVLFSGNSDNRKGAFNATIERIKHLQSLDQFVIDVYMLQFYNGFFKKVLFRRRNREIVKSFAVDEILINNIWQKSTIFNTRRFYKYRKYSIEYRKTINILNTLVDNYDIISVHSYVCANLVSGICRIKEKPFCITWHGTDIHTNPFVNNTFFLETRSLIEHAAANFFVSEKLRETSNKITTKGNKFVLYNGVDKSLFYKYSSEKREVVKKQLGIEYDYYNIGVIGGLIDVKNSMILPDLIKKIASVIPNVILHVVGDGYLRHELEIKSSNLPVIFHGNVPIDRMPDYYNVFDLVIMPSKNEGLPLTAVESLACGTLLVGSRVGGIPEVVGEANTVELDDKFVTVFSHLCVNRLLDKTTICLPNVFDWERTAEKEAEIYRNL